MQSERMPFLCVLALWCALVLGAMPAHAAIGTVGSEQKLTFAASGWRC
jgi:hypothetical protein